MISTIETVNHHHFESVLDLIGDYQKFYGATPVREKNRAHFSQFIERHDRGIVFCASVAGEIVGFTTLYFNMASVNPGKACLLNDLFCSPGARGRGVGRSLIGHAQNYARLAGYSEIEWQTHQDNKIAQALYDKLGAQRSGWFTYTLGTA